MDRITHSSDFMMLAMKLSDYQISRAAIDKHAPCFMFSDYITEYTHNSYIYQDLTVDYVFNMYDNASPLSRYTPLPPRVPAGDSSSAARTGNARTAP